MKKIQIVKSAVEVIRKRSGQYLGAEKPTGKLLVNRVLRDVVWFDAMPAFVDHEHDWWLVASSKDWLFATGIDDLTLLFSRIVSLPDRGHCNHRAEVILSAFARAIITRGSEGETTIKEDKKVSPLPARLSQYLDPARFARTIAFAI